MPPRARAASNRIRALVARANLERKKCLAISLAFLSVHAGKQFRDLYQDAGATSTDYLIVTVYVLLMSTIIFWAWSRIGRERSQARR